MGKFAFIIHPLKLEDYYRKFPALKLLPGRVLETAVKFVPPFKASRVTGIRSIQGAETEGWFIACNLLPEQFFSCDEDFVLKRIIQAGRKAEELGADIVGLGAFTSVVGDKGETVAENLTIPVTTGNSYTVATALQAIEHTLDFFDLKPEDLTLAIVGATGSIGRTCAELTASRFGLLNLIGRSEKRLEKVKKSAEGADATHLQISTSMDPLRDSDIIITVTSAVESIIDPNIFKPGAIVCDIARPRDVSHKLAQVRQDVLLIDGGVVSIPGDVDFGFDFGFPPHTAYACMAETFILALEERFESFSLGPHLDPQRVKDIRRLAEKHGFTLAGMRSFERAITPEDLHQFESHIRSRPLKVDL